MEPHDLAVVARRHFGNPAEETDPPYGETLLHAAAYVGRLALVEMLISAGAKPSVAGTLSGCTPLHAAALGGQAEICARLLAAGAEVGLLTTATKRSALHFACLKGHAET